MHIPLYGVCASLQKESRLRRNSPMPFISEPQGGASTMAGLSSLFETYIAGNNTHYGSAKHTTCMYVRNETG